MNNLWLSKDGIKVAEKFSSLDELSAINHELDELFYDKNFSLNCTLSHVYISDSYLIIPSPSLSIFSVNIPEKAIDVMEVILNSSSKNEKDLIVTSIGHLEKLIQI